MSEKMKVYVETTVVSDATALPTNDLALAGRQITTRKWWRTRLPQYAMDFLVSWNFKHITNAQTIPLVKRICGDNGFICAEICTPYQLQAEGGAA